MYSRQSSCNLVNCSSSCLLYFMFMYTLVILTELLLYKYTVFIFHNYYLQPLAECRVNSYKHSACLSSESSPVWFILVPRQPYVVHVIAFGFVAKCLETEVHNAKFHPKARVLSKSERVWVAWKVCVVGIVVTKITGIVWKQLYFSLTRQQNCS